jgi:hypothetical protein
VRQVSEETPELTPVCGGLLISVPAPEPEPEAEPEGPVSGNQDDPDYDPAYDPHPFG